MSWKRKVFISLLIVSIISLGVFIWMSSGDVRQSNLGGKYSGYVQYVLGTEIDFASGGNSAEFVKSNIGWAIGNIEVFCSRWHRNTTSVKNFWIWCL